MIEALPSLSLIAAILIGFTVGGSVKGAFGIGFPAVVMSILPFFIAPSLAIALLALPIVVTNIQQIVTMPGWPKVVLRFLLAGISTGITMLIVSQFLVEASRPFVEICVGLALVIFALTGLFKIDLPVSDGWRWQLGFGITSGIVGGLTAIKAPTMIYTAALKLPRDEFMVAAGFMFFCGGTGLLTGVLTGGLLDLALLPLSIAAVAAAFVGFKIGERVRARLQPELYRKLLLWLMLVLGLRMVWMNLV